MDNSESIGVYGEAKAEYTRQLCSFLVPALETYFLDLLTEVKTSEKDPKRFLWAFQDALKQFPDWNIDKVQRETEKVHSETKCDYLEEILTAVFIAHTKVLSAIRLTSKQKKLQITIPKIDHFLHRTMSECARLLWSNAYLFSEAGPAIERQKNLRQVEQLLHEGVLQSIRGMLPVKSILKEYLADDGDETPAEAAAAEATPQEEETQPVIHEDSIQGGAEEERPKETSPEESVDAPVETLDISGAGVPPAPPSSPVTQPTTLTAGPSQPATAGPSQPATPPTIIVETEPPSVGFTSMDAVLDVENPEKTTIQASTQSEDDDDDEKEVTHIEYDENEAAEPIDEFETLELAQETIAVGEDEFETL